MTERGFYEVSDRDRPDIRLRSARLKSKHIRVIDLKFDGIFDDPEPLFSRDEIDQRFCKRRLAGIGSAGDQDGFVGTNGIGQKGRQTHGDHAGRDELLHREPMRPELANRERDTRERTGWECGRDARPIRQSRVEQRIRFSDIVAKRAGDPLDGSHQMPRFEDRIDRHQLTPALDEDGAVAVDHDLGDGVFQKVGSNRFEKRENGFKRHDS